jgi:hypothetical protein
MATTRSADSMVLSPKACSTVTGNPAPDAVVESSEDPASAPPEQAVRSRAVRPSEATAARRRGLREEGTAILLRGMEIVKVNLT